MRIDEVALCAEGLDGVRSTRRQGLAEWRYHGRLVARQLDAAHVVIRAEFGYRDALAREHPETFSVPHHFAKHMMVVADLTTCDANLVVDAIEAAWELQRSADLSGPICLSELARRVVRDPAGGAA